MKDPSHKEQKIKVCEKKREAVGCRKREGELVERGKKCVCVCVWGGGLEMGKGKRGVYFGKEREKVYQCDGAQTTRGGLEMGKGVFWQGKGEQCDGAQTTSDGSLSPSLYLYHHSPWTHVSKTEEKVSCKSSYTNLCMYV